MDYPSKIKVKIDVYEKGKTYISKYCFFLLPYRGYGDLQKRPERGTVKCFSISSCTGAKLPEARQIQFLDICPSVEPLGLDRRAVILKADWISMLHHRRPNVDSLCVCVCFFNPEEIQGTAAQRFDDCPVYGVLLPLYLVEVS